MGQLFASFNFRNYRLWFFAALISNVGTWMQRVAQDWVVLTELSEHSAVAVGMVTALQFVPAVILTPFAGVLTDRLDKRVMLIVSQALLGAIALVTGVLLLTDVAELWHMCVLAASLGVVTAFEAPSRQVFVTELVPPSHIGNAVALNASSLNAGRLVGPAVAGIGIAAIGSGWIFIVNAISFAATIAATLVMRKSDLRPPPKANSKRGQMAEGLKYIRSRSDIIIILIVVVVVASLGFNFPLTSAVMATEVFHAGAEDYGILGSMMAIGALAGAMMAARRTRPRARVVIIAAFVYGVFDALSAIAPTFWSFAFLAIPTGFFALTVLTAANAAIQMSTSPHLRGRVMSIYIMVFFGATPLGAPLIGWIAETFDARWSIGVGAIASMLVAVIAALWTRKNWGVEVTYTLRNRPFIKMTNRQDRDAGAGDAG